MSIVYEIENLWWPFGAHLLHMKWNIIKTKQLSAKLIYRRNNHLTFPEGNVLYYFEDCSDPISDFDTIIKVGRLDISDHDREEYFCAPYKSTKEMHVDLMRRVYKPSTLMKQFVNDDIFLKSLVPNTYIAMHVRWSDKVFGHNKETEYIPIDKYIEACVNIRSTHPEINTIVLITDNIDAIVKLKEANELHGFVILYKENEKRCENNMQDAIVQKANNGQSSHERLHEEYITGFINFEIMLKSFAIVGNYDSGYCFVPVELRDLPHRDVNVKGNTKPLWGCAWI